MLRKAAKLIRAHFSIDATALDLHKFPPEHRGYKARKTLMFAFLVMHLLQTHPSDVVLALICDDEQDVAIPYYEFLQTYKRQHQASAHRLGGICFYNDKHITMLQASDMAAFVNRQHLCGEASELYNTLFDGSVETKKSVIITHSGT